MGPPTPESPLAEIDEFWTDEGICMSLSNFKSGRPLPLNVTSDVNPYQVKPSDLPEDLWYFFSGGKKDVEFGFWLEKGKACEIFSNPAIIGFRTTLQFYEGRIPNARKTDWMMQEYTITEKYNNNLKDSRALCRVFLADIDVNNSQHISKSELVEKIIENDTGPSLVAKRSPDRFLENFSEMDYILSGDYLELNDLVDPGSRSSSSLNSSCLTMTSEDYFDSMALLQELDDDMKDQEKKANLNVKFNISESVKSKVVIHPPSSGCVRSGKDGKASSEGASKVDDRNGSTSNGNCEGRSKEGKKERVDGTKKGKMMKYLCFMAF